MDADGCLEPGDQVVCPMGWVGTIQSMDLTVGDGIVHLQYPNGRQVWWFINDCTMPTKQELKAKRSSNIDYVTWLKQMRLMVLLDDQLYKIWKADVLATSLDKFIHEYKQWLNEQRVAKGPVKL